MIIENCGPLDFAIKKLRGVFGNLIYPNTHEQEKTSDREPVSLTVHYPPSH